MRRRLLLMLILPVLAVGYVWATAAPAAQDLLLENFIFDTRADLEILADEVFGIGTRPEMWTFSTDAASMTAASDLWFDNETLATELFGSETSRPDDWFGLTASNPRIIARNVRHDLEISADEALGDGSRPPQWRGAPALLRCGRTLQNVAEVLQRNYGATLTTPESTVDYCGSVLAELEDDLLNVIYTDQDIDELAELTLAVRGDLERLANEKFGLDNRPAGYIRNLDVNSPTLASDIFLDMGLLADTVEELGEGVRPEGWIGSITNNAETTYINLRHDLELLADTTLGFSVRPNGWQGVDPLQRCDPLGQNIRLLAVELHNFNLPPGLDSNAPGFCEQIETAANQIIENPPVEDVVEEDQIESRFIADSNYAFAYLDPCARLYMGIIPPDNEFRALYRNFGDSGMMYVMAMDNEFAVYVRYDFTTLPIEVFDSLPTIPDRSPETYCNPENNPRTFCDDNSWCNGPGPTPTPTGFGPLAAVIQQATPPGTPTPDDIPGGGGIGTKVQVSWNNIRVTYFQDNTETRTAQVGFEICRQAAQNATACESVIRVEGTQGEVLTPLTQINGLNVYEFEYGYTSGILIEGETLFSNDVWISDPTIR